MITYEFDQANKLIRARVSGVLTVSETIEYFCRLQQDPSCPDRAIEIVDFTDATDLSLQYTEMRRITQRYQSAKLEKNIMATIFVCVSDLSYGIGRMLQAIHNLTNEYHKVILVRSEEELVKNIKEIRRGRVL